ncbi:hypothetical protein DSECCO2_350920 [anaerobic digester metagenome]
MDHFVQISAYFLFLKKRLFVPPARHFNEFILCHDGLTVRLPFLREKGASHGALDYRWSR